MHNFSEKTTLAGREREISRARLGGFLRLNVAKKKLYAAVERGDTGAIADSLFLHLKEAIPDLDRSVFNKLDWYEIVYTFSLIERINIIPNQDKFAILVTAVEGQDEAWHYDERFYYAMIHTLASSYNWRKEEIDNLWPEEAIAFLQEIIADEYKSMSFEHALSPVSYPYNKRTKKSKYVPLQRPGWMSQDIGKPRKNKLGGVPEEFLPKGNVEKSPLRADKNE